MKRILTTAWLCAAVLAWSADVYIRDGGTGNGSAWNNALDDIPATLTRGNTYWIGDGNYNDPEFDDAVSGTTLITIKKATVADHGSEPGWLDSYGDGQAVFAGGMQFSTNYWLVDGNTPVGTYGFRVNGDGRNYIVDMYTTSTDQIELRGIHSYGGGQGYGRGFIGKSGTFHLYNCRAELTADDGMAFVGATYVTIEYSHVGWRGSSVVGAHADGIAFMSGGSPNGIIRHTIIDWDGQEVWFDGVGDALYGDFQFYGNLFLNTEEAIPVNSNQAIKDHANASLGQFLVYNNTFAGIYQAQTATGNANSVWRNNIYYDLTIQTISFGSGTHSHNYFQTGMTYPAEATAQEGGDPFADYGNGDFSLSAATDAGYSLASPYNADRVGNTRGSDGTWDRGAYEFDEGGAPEPAYFLMGGS